MKKAILIILIIFNLPFPQSIKADVKLPAIVSSNMVLQRNTTVKIWGWSDAKEKITIAASWLQMPVAVTADKKGNWHINVKTNNSKKPQQINIVSKTSNINLTNILFGEVWLCSGQSNMEQPLKGYPGQPTFESQMAIAKANNPKLRLFIIKRKASIKPIDDIVDYIGWKEASPESVSDFSAVAYFFGQQLQEILDVPIGLIQSAWGGSKVQAWMSTEALQTYDYIDTNPTTVPQKKTQNVPTLLFNAMINPITPYTIKGALWYQGESNRNEPENYKELFPDMVKDWRQRWDLGDFPFYYVQIAPYWYRNNDAFQTAENTAFIRESQLECLDLIPNSGIAITMDLGKEFFIHPPKKKEVANRLLYNALNYTYGFTSVDCASPIFSSLETKKDGLILKFKNAETGLFTFDTLKGFEIAGKDKVFYPAKADIIKRTHLFVSSPKVPHPVAVRYAWRNWTVGTLFDTNLLPASSFRTDKWKDASRYSK
mgnify:CR=1 FL=1